MRVGVDTGGAFTAPPGVNDDGRLGAANTSDDTEGRVNDATFGGVGARTDDPDTVHGTQADGFGGRDWADGMDAVRVSTTMNTPVEERDGACVVDEGGDGASSLGGRPMTDGVERRRRGTPGTSTPLGRGVLATDTRGTARVA